MIFALFLQLAQIFDTSGENPHNSEQTELRLQQRWKVQFVTAMSQPVQLVLCVLLLNLRFRHLWLIYSRIATSHYGARCDILKTKSDSDGAGKNSACKIISEPFQRPQGIFLIYYWHQRLSSVLPSVFCFIFIFLHFWNVFSCPVFLFVRWNLF